MSELEFESVVDKKTVKLKLRNETVDIERKCDTEYHIAYTQLLTKGIHPNAQLEKIMAKQGLWDEDSEKELGHLQKQLVELQIKMAGSNTHEEGLVYAQKMSDLRSACLRMVEVKAAVLSNSCESLADQIRRDAYLAYATVFAGTNKPVFKDYDNFLTRAEEQVVLDARKAFLVRGMETFQESLDMLPEVEYVRTVQESRQEDLEKKAKRAAKKKKTTKKKATARKSK